MRSTFMGFNTARSGLFAAQRALDITGHNLSNVNTPGYTRQRLEQQQATPMAIYGGSGMLGTGVEMVGVRQSRNDFLDARYRAEVNSHAYWETKQNGLLFVESMFKEPSDTGIRSNVDGYFNAWEELSKEQNVNELTHRALVFDQAVGTANSIAHQYDQLEKMAVDLNRDVVATVTDINSYADQIARLNRQIYLLESDGSKANDLRDQRNLMIDRLSELVEVEILEVSDPSAPPTAPKKMILQIGGQPLVSHDRAYHLSAQEKEKSAFFDEMGVDLEMNRVSWADGSYLNPKQLKGELRALLDLRDGNTPSNKGVPYYIQQLNEFAVTFAKEMNEVARTGYGLKGETLDPPMGSEEFGAGYLMFTANGVASEEMYDADGNILHHKINAKNIRVSLDMEDLNKIPASASKAGLPGDATVAMKIVALRKKDSMFAEGKPEDFINSLVAKLGVEMQQAIRNTDNQALLVEQLQRSRMQVSGVSQDEELAKMVMYQHAYNASARMITTMDEMLDVIINRIGLVGR